MRTMRRVSLLLAFSSGVHAYHQSEFVELWEQVPQTCINVRAGDTTRDSTAKEMPSWSGYGDVSYRCENDPYCEGRFRVYESDFGRHGWWGDEYDRSDWAKMQAICAWFGGRKSSSICTPTSASRSTTTTTSSAASSASELRRRNFLPDPPTTPLPLVRVRPTNRNLPLPLPLPSRQRPPAPSRHSIG